MGTTTRDLKVKKCGKRAVKAVIHAAGKGAWTDEAILRAADGLAQGEKAFGVSRRWPQLAARLRKIVMKDGSKPPKPKKKPAAPAKADDAPAPDPQAEKTGPESDEEVVETIDVETGSTTPGRRAPGISLAEELDRMAAQKPAPTNASRAPHGAREGKATKDSPPAEPTHTRARKAKGEAKGAPGPKGAPRTPVAPSATMTVAQLADAYLHHLEAKGKTASTVRSYRGDLNVAIRELGDQTKTADLTNERIQAYFDSDAVCKNRQGERRSEITIAKVRRVFRMAMGWSQRPLASDAAVDAR